MCSYNVLMSFGTIESFGGEIASFFIMGFCKNITFYFPMFLFVLCRLLAMIRICRADHTDSDIVLAKS